MQSIMQRQLQHMTTERCSYAAWFSKFGETVRGIQRFSQHEWADCNMQVRQVLCVVLLVLTVLILPDRVGAQPRLLPIDTIWLEETANAYLALPSALHPDLDGYLVTDARQAVVLRFTAGGRLVQQYGSEGEGPGEFREAAVALPYDLRDIIVLSWQPPAAQRFDRATGAFVQGYQLTGISHAALVAGDTVWVGGPRYGQDAGVERLILGQRSSVFMAPLPRTFRYGGPVGGIFPHVSLTRWADTLMVGYEPTEYVLLVTQVAGVVETISIPHQRRRGVPDDLEARLLQAMRRYYPEVFGVLSALRELHRLPDGSTALVHFDSHPETPPVSSDAFLSVLSADRRRACVDAPIPLGPEAHPVVGFKADTILVLEQQVKGLDALAFVARYIVDTSLCTWLPTAIER